jgi:hypothetical protein
VVLSTLEAAWVLPAALVAGGLVFLADAAAESGPRKHTAETFVLNVLALPIGGFIFGVGVADALVAHHVPLGPGAALVVGAILVGRSLREVPWTGVVSLGAAAAAGWFLTTHSPWTLSVFDLLAATTVVFLVVFVLLYLIELPLRLAGLFSLPRLFLIVLGIASLVLAGYVYFGGTFL